MWDEDDEDYTDEICPDCNGSGEGSYDGSTCRSCKGSGVERMLIDPIYEEDED